MNVAKARCNPMHAKYARTISCCSMLPIWPVPKKPADRDPDPNLTRASPQSPTPLDVPGKRIHKTWDSEVFEPYAPRNSTLQKLTSSHQAIPHTYHLPEALGLIWSKRETTARSQAHALYFTSRTLLLSL